MKLPLIEILILNYNGREIIKECLDSIFKKTKYKKYKVIVIDNGSTDSSIETIKRYNKVKLIRLSFNYGFSGGFNKAISKTLVSSNSEFYVLMNNDIIITDSLWLNKLVKPMLRNDKIGLTCGPLIKPDGSRQTGGWMKLNGLTMSYMKQNNSKEDCYLDFAHGGATLVKKEVMSKTHGFDEKFNPFTSEETDFSLRTKKFGYKIYYVHDVELLHKHGKTVNTFSEYTRYYIMKRNMVRFRFLHYPLLWILLSFILDFKVILNAFIKKNSKGITLNLYFYRELKYYFLALIYNFLNLGEILNRRTIINLTKK